MIYTQHILYIGYGALALSAILLGAWYLLRQKVMREAHSEYQDRARELPHTIKNVDEETFIALYVGCHSPRWLKYMAGILATAVVVSPIVLLVVPAIYHEIWKATGEHDWAGRDGYVFMFSLFFAIAGVWAALGAVFARFHHARNANLSR